jgi:hypothetical protein
MSDEYRVTISTKDGSESTTRSGESVGDAFASAMIDAKISRVFYELAMAINSVTRWTTDCDYVFPPHEAKLVDAAHSLIHEYNKLETGKGEPR